MITGYVCYFALLFQGRRLPRVPRPHGGATAGNIAIQTAERHASTSPSP